jgi:hypothetical protein
MTEPVNVSELAELLAGATERPWLLSGDVDAAARGETTDLMIHTEPPPDPDAHPEAFDAWCDLDREVASVGPFKTLPTSGHDARLIVAAVNAIEPLTEALEVARDALEPVADAAQYRRCRWCQMLDGHSPSCPVRLATEALARIDALVSPVSPEAE